MAFSLFGKKQKSILGVDIGGGGVKLVELKHEKKRPLLHTYSYMEKTFGEEEKGLLDDPKYTAALIKRMMKESKTTTTRAVAGLPVSSVFSSIISVPSSSGKELKAAIEWQARKLIPLPLEEMILDWKILQDGEKKQKDFKSFGPGLLGTKEAKQFLGTKASKENEGPPELGKKGMRILLTGASKELVEKYKIITKEAGLELVALETEAYAMIRSLVGHDLGTVMIIDFGTRRTSLVIVQNGIPVLTRSISLGGINITRTISKILGVEEIDAENMKCDVEKLSVLGGNGEMPALLVKTIEPLMTEARYSIGLYSKQQAQSKDSHRIEKIVLTGGSAHLPYLAQYISKSLDVSVFVGDPWARVNTHEDLRGVLDDLGPRFAVSVGLAMRDFE